MKGKILRNEKGVVLIVALMLLLVLVVIGISAISTTTFENNIAGNERVATDAFYASEAGVQLGLNQLPFNTSPIPRTALKNDSYYWTGSPADKDAPKGATSFGLYSDGVYDTDWAFKRFQFNATGESINAVKETEFQVRFGPFKSGTPYNN